MLITYLTIEKPLVPSAASERALILVDNTLVVGVSWQMTENKYFISPWHAGGTFTPTLSGLEFPAVNQFDASVGEIGTYPASLL